MDIKELVINKFHENPGKFAATILKMYWDMEKQHDQYKQAYQHCVDDLIVLRANNKRLERENAELKEKNGELQEVIEGKNSDLLFTEDENTQLKQDLLRTEELQDDIIQLEKDFENKHNLLSEISQHIGNKPSSSTYKYFRAKLDGIGIKEGD